MVETVPAMALIRRSVEDKEKKVCSIEMQKNAIQDATQQELLGAKATIKPGTYPEGHWFIEDGVSGKHTDKEREPLQIAKELAEQGKIKRIYVWDYDRFSRKSSFALDYLENLLQHDVLLISTISPLDYRPEDGWYMLTLKFSTAQYEREHGGRRTRAVMLDKARHGSWCGGRHYGYKNIDGELKIDPNQSITVKNIYTWYLQGKSMRAIQRTLEQKEIPSPGGKNHWNPKTISSILGNPIYPGYLYYGGEFSQGNHQPIITVETYNKAQQKRAENTKNKSTTRQQIIKKNTSNRVPRTITKYRLYTIDPETTEITPL